MTEILSIFLSGRVNRNKVIRLLELHFAASGLRFIHVVKSKKQSEEIILKSPNNEEFNKRLRELRDKNVCQFHVSCYWKKI